MVYENYIDWIAQYLMQDRIFVPHSICSGGFDETSCFTVAETWDNFIAGAHSLVQQITCFLASLLPCFLASLLTHSLTHTINYSLTHSLLDSLTKFSQLAVQMNAIIPPRANELQVLSNKPDLISIQDKGVYRNRKYVRIFSLPYFVSHYFVLLLIYPLIIHSLTHSLT